MHTQTHEAAQSSILKLRDEVQALQAAEAELSSTRQIVAQLQSEVRCLS